MDFPFLRLTRLVAMPYTNLQQQQSQVNMCDMAPFLGVLASQWRDDYTPSTLVEAEFYTHWNRNTVDFIMLPLLPSPQDSSRFLMHVLDDHSSPYTSASEQDIHFRDRKKN